MLNEKEKKDISFPPRRVLHKQRPKGKEENDSF